MRDIDMYKFIDNNNLDRIEGVLTTLNSTYSDSPEFRKNFYLIVYLLIDYYNQNNCNDKLDFFLSDIATINYLKDKDILGFLMSLINLDNKYKLDFQYELEDLKLLLDTSKAYLDTKRSNYHVLDNKFLSILIDLYANCCGEMNADIKELFILALYNNYSNMNIEDLDYFEFQLSKVYYNFINDEYFMNMDISNLEVAYHEIEEYLIDVLDIKTNRK